MSEKPSLSRGASLTADTWADFVARLHNDCVGDGVRNHHTADAVFLVKQRVKVYCPEGCDGEAFDIYHDGESNCPRHWYDLSSEVEKQELDTACSGSFLEATKYDQMNAVAESCPNAELHEYDWGWVTLNQHFTQDAAEAFIKRKKHDYRDGLRVWVDASTYSWELNAIKQGILAGRIGFIPDAPKQEGA